jgi:hypothetical protein
LALLAGCSAVFGLGGVQEKLFIEWLGVAPERLVYFTSARVGLATIALTVGAMVAGSLLFPDKKNPGEEARP